MSLNSSNNTSLSQEQINPVELVLFYGPPCSGKTRFYHREYAQTHTRISPKDDYPDKSLHYVVSEALKLLREGNNVVIDDCNAHEDTRQSYVTRVKEALPLTRTVLVVFRPVHGVRQCEWQLEWQLAAHCADDQRASDAQHGTYIDWSAWQKTFEHEPVSLLEGFTSTRYVDSQLYSVRTSDQFTAAALVIEAQALVEYSIDELFQVTCTLQPHVSRVLREWSGSHGNWHMLVLVDESALYPMSIELIEDPELQITVLQRCRTAFEQQLKSLQLSKPLYYLISAYNCFEQTHFFKLHRGGMIAWAHMRHGLALTQCVYVTATAKNKPVTVPCGLKYCHAADLFNDNGWGTDSKLRKYTREQASPQTSALLHDVEYSTVPMPLAVALQGTARSEWTISTEQGGFGRVHGCCWPGVLSVSNELPAAVGVPAERAHTTPRKNRALPEWLSPSKTSPKSTNNNIVATEKTMKIVETEKASYGTEEDPVSQDLQPSQSSLFDNLSQDSSEAANEKQQTKRKRSEDEPSEDEIKAKKAKI